MEIGNPVSAAPKPRVQLIGQTEDLGNVQRKLLKAPQASLPSVGIEARAADVKTYDAKAILQQGPRPGIDLYA